MQKDANGYFFWSKKRDFSIPSEEDLKKLVLPENVSFRFHFCNLFFIFVLSLHVLGWHLLRCYSREICNFF